MPCQPVWHIWEWASVTPPKLVGFRWIIWTHLFSMIMLIVPLFWSYFLLSQCPPAHKHSTTKVLDGFWKTSFCPLSTLLCSEALPIFDLCRTCPGPGSLYFHFVVFTLTAILAPFRRAPLTTPWGKENTPKPFLGSCLLHVLWSCWM